MGSSAMNLARQWAAHLYEQCRATNGMKWARSIFSKSPRKSHSPK